jgi:hypothetical protein
MAPSKKKRFSAFEDFPTAEKTVAPLKNINSTKDAAANVERIERLRPSEMMPDRFQPRRLLPAHIRPQFYNFEIDCYQAATEWLKFAQQDSGVKAEVEKLLSLGNSFDEHGQIKPITGSWMNNEQGNFIFMIETGERRFWAACLQVVFQKIETEPLLRIEVIDQPTRYRQVLENRHAEIPSAVEQSCEVAALILAELGIQPDSKVHDDYDYFRLARAQRMPAGLWDRIIPIMQLTRPRMVQLLNILQFSSNSLELADRFRLPERVLREILNQPNHEWESLIRHAIQNNLTSEDIFDQILEKESTTKTKTIQKTDTPPEKNAQRTLSRFTRVFRKVDHIEQSEILDHLADSLIVSDRAQETLDILDELATLIRARLTRQ